MKMSRSKHQKYVNIKESKVDWIGEIPQHWNIKRLKFIIENGLQYGANEAAELDDRQLPRYIRITDIDENGNLREDTFRSLPEEIALNFLLKEGDILFARSGATVGKTFLYRNSWGTCAYAGYLIKASLKKSLVSPDFISYCSKSKGYSSWIASMLIQATIQNVSAEKYASFVFPFPTLPEQLSIAAFLDRETARIDALIEKKKKLILLLKEKRTALITRAVTKGLNPAVKMKPSGNEWLGEIPEHWEVKRLKEIANVNPSKSNISSDLVENDVEISFLPMEKVGEDGTIRLDENKRISQVINSFTYFENGDVIIAKITPCFENGKGALVQNLLNGIGFGSTEFHVWRTNPNFQKWLFYYSISGFFRKFGESSMTGAAGQKRVTTDFIKTFSVAIPPIHEIKSITDILEAKLQDIDLLILKIDASINKNSEYRTALISAAVTGKIRVGETEGDTLK